VNDSSVGRKGFQFACDPVIKTGTDANQQIRFLDSKVGISGSVHSEHIKREGVILVKCSQTHQGHRDRNIGLLGEFSEGLGGIAADDTAADIEDRTLGGVDGLGSTADLSGVAVFPDAIARQFNGLRRCCRDLGNLHVDGNINQHRAGSSCGSDIEGLADGLSQLIRIFDDYIMFGNRTRDAGGVGFLKGIIADQVCADLAGEGDNRHGIHHCSSQTSR